MHLSNHRGITLLEVLVAIIVFAVGILGLAPMIVLAVDGNNVSRDVLTASTLAQDYIEMYKTDGVYAIAPYESYESNIHGGYSRKVQIIDDTIDSTIANGCQQLDITIGWEDSFGVNRSSFFSTLIYVGD